MYFTKAAIVAISAFAATVAAQAAVQFTSFPPSTVQAGKSYSITYMGDASKPATILLRRGPSGNLQTVATLTTKALAGAYEFTPSSSLSNGNDYALEIEQDGQNNYTPQFAITGGMGGSSSSTTSASSTSSTGSSSAETSMVTMPFPAGNTSSIAPTGTAASTGLPTSSSGSNGTITSATISPSTPAQTSAPAAATTTAVASAAAGHLGSPLALIAGIVAGLAYLN